MNKKTLELAANIIVLVAAINLGIAGLIEKDLLFGILGDTRWLVRTVEIIIGVSGVYLALKMAKAIK
jgi:uncharacterized membrane protein YuzA (DUF378 family)